jgi:hypothetical protein
MMKVNWLLLGKSVLACAIGAYIGNLPLWLGPYIADIFAGPHQPKGYDVYTIQLGFIFYLLIASATFMGSCLIGLPIQYLLIKHKLTDLWLFVGLYVGASMLILFILSLPASGFVNLNTLLYPAMSSFLSVVIFWLIRRPDRDEKSSASG